MYANASAVVCARVKCVIAVSTCFDITAKPIDVDSHFLSYPAALFHEIRSVFLPSERNIWYGTGKVDGYKTGQTEHGTDAAMDKKDKNIMPPVQHIGYGCTNTK